MRTLRMLLPASLFASIGLVAVPAAAVDSTDARLAQALFEEARQLMAQKRYAEACPKLEESQRRDPGGGTLLNLALCHENEGKTATAYVEYNEALAAATRDGRRDRQDFARTHITAIEANVPRLSVVVRPEDQVPGLEITFDGTTLPRAAWGVATPVDPGAHTVTATAPGRTRWAVTLSMLPGEKKSVDVPLPAPEATVAPVPAGLEPQPHEPAATVMPQTSGSPRANPVFYGVLGLTAIGAVTTLVAGVAALTASGAADDGCLPERSYCRDAESKDAAERAGTMAWVSTGALVVTVVAAGALLFIPSRTAAARTGLAPGALRLGGSF